MSATKGPAPQKYDGSSLRVAIVHARWNRTIIDPLVQGAKDKLLECGVKEANIVTQTVPGSWELPTAVQRYAPAARLHLPPPRGLLPLVILTIAPSPQTLRGVADPELGKRGIHLGGRPPRILDVGSPVSHDFGAGRWTL